MVTFFYIYNIHDWSRRIVLGQKLRWFAQKWPVVIDHYPTFDPLEAHGFGHLNLGQKIKVSVSDHFSNGYFRS